MKDGKTKRPGLLSSFIRHLQPQPGRAEPKAKSGERASRGHEAPRRGSDGRDGDTRRRDRDDDDGRKGHARDEEERESDEQDEDDRAQDSRDEDDRDAGDAVDSGEEDAESSYGRSFGRDTGQRGRESARTRSDKHDEGGNGGRASRSRLSGAQAVRIAQEYLVQLTGREPEAVSGLQRSNDGWSVTLEVVEMERIPETTDVMGSFRVQLDEGGDLNGCTRVRRYYRNQQVEG